MFSMFILHLGADLRNNHSGKMATKQANCGIFPKNDKFSKARCIFALDFLQHMLSIPTVRHL